ncbi:ferredoxin [Emticicia sp. TH156]|uniref:(2Fe-2S) ferredoxin domain-containing protein n=1 Tax=Emticicia sp. TH156 TaxID=2067454 RepID=UPI000C7851DD|nr:(2Fe-2S) ferredoxin domain-containing protein [Emticicia sp. TH156]PLK43621.1 2Fe-2S ferredoxin [Emticicia sp. TH156]
MSKIEIPDHTIFVCDGSKCGKYSKEIRKVFKEKIKENHLKAEVLLVKMDCSDNCDYAPVVCFQPENAWHGEVTEKKAEKFFGKYILGE